MSTQHLLDCFYSLLKNELQFSQSVKHDIVVVLFKTLMKITSMQLKAYTGQTEKYEKVLKDFQKWLKSFERFPFLLEDIFKIQQMFLQSDMTILPESIQKSLYPGDPSRSLLFISKNSYLFLQSLPQYDNIRSLLPKTIDYLQDIPRHEMYSEGISIIHECNITAVVKSNTEMEYTPGIPKELSNFYTRLDELAYNRQVQEAKAISQMDPSAGRKLQSQKWVPDIKRDQIDLYFHPVPEQSIPTVHCYSSMYVNKKNLERTQCKIDVLSLNNVDLSSDITKVEIGVNCGVVAFGLQSGRINVMILDQMKKKKAKDWMTKNLEKVEKRKGSSMPPPQPGSEQNQEETMEEEKKEEEGASFNLNWFDDYFESAKEKFEEEVLNFSSFNERKETVNHFPQVKLLGHQGMITCLGVSFDENYLVSGSIDSTIRCWNITLGACLAVYRSHIRTVWDIFLSQRGPYFLSGGEEGLAIFWSTNNPKPLCAQAHKCPVTQVTLSQSLKYGVSYSIDRTIFIWELKKDSVPSRIIFTDFFVSSLAMKMNGDILYIGYENGHLQTWDVAKMNKLRTIRSSSTARQTWKSQVISISLSHDEKLMLVVTGSTFGIFNLPDLETIPSSDALELGQTEQKDFFTRNEVKPNRIYKFENEDSEKMSLDSIRIVGGIMHVMNFAFLVTSSTRWEQPKPSQAKSK